MNDNPPAYGLWPLVVINSAVFIIFAFSFTRPRTSRDWRSFGGLLRLPRGALHGDVRVPALYLLSGWLGKRYPGIDLFSHDAGHLWETLLGWEGDAHVNPLHLLSNVLIGGGFILLASAWKVLYEAQRAGELATTGPYARMRHPQYAGFIVILLGFLFQWPTLLTLVMFPVLVVMYVRLARSEERDARATFGEAYDRYAVATPGFFPRLGKKPSITTARRGASGG